jgi:hypothetical protein
VKERLPRDQPAKTPAWPEAMIALNAEEESSPEQGPAFAKIRPDGWATGGGDARELPGEHGVQDAGAGDGVDEGQQPTCFLARSVHRNGAFHLAQSARSTVSSNSASPAAP